MLLPWAVQAVLPTKFSLAGRKTCAALGAWGRPSTPGCECRRAPWQLTALPTLHLYWASTQNSSTHSAPGVIRPDSLNMTKKKNPDTAWDRATSALRLGQPHPLVLPPAPVSVNSGKNLQLHLQYVRQQSSLSHKQTHKIQENPSFYAVSA